MKALDGVRESSHSSSTTGCDEHPERRIGRPQADCPNVTGRLDEAGGEVPKRKVRRKPSWKCRELFGPPPMARTDPPRG
jgi:hypothetical protein